MKNLNLKTIIELVLLIHGIGMLGGVYFVFTKPSWFAKILDEKLATYLAATLWIVAGAALIATAWALFKDLVWWKTAAVTALVTMTTGTAIWYDAVPAGAVFGSILSFLGLIYLFIKN